MRAGEGLADEGASPLEPAPDAAQLKLKARKTLDSTSGSRPGPQRKPRLKLIEADARNSRSDRHHGVSPTEAGQIHLVRYIRVTIASMNLCSRSVRLSSGFSIIVM